MKPAKSVERSLNYDNLGELKRSNKVCSGSVKSVYQNRETESLRFNQFRQSVEKISEHIEKSLFLKQKKQMKSEL